MTYTVAGSGTCLFSRAFPCRRTDGAPADRELMATFKILLALVAFCFTLEMLAQRMDMPAATPPVFGDRSFALIPRLPTVKLNSELALALFLPSVVQVSAFSTNDLPTYTR